jgi:Protein of unknown function (DUF2934)
MANKTTGRSKKTSNKPLKEPIPINTGSSSLQPGSTSIKPDHTPRTQEYPGIEEEVRRRAYELYEERGRQEGFHDEDWARAESEILSKHKTERSA